MTDTNDAASARQLRRLRWWDLPQVLAIEQRLFPEDPWSAEAFWSELAGVPGSRHAVALDVRGAVRGYAILRCVAGEAEVQTIAVDPVAQGGGAGRLMLHALLDEARRRGAASVMLEVRSDNQPALTLYRSEGFEQLAVRRGYYQHSGADALILRRRMTTAASGDETERS